MSDAPFTIPLTPAEFTQARQALAAQGVALPTGDSCTLTHEGVTVECVYNGTDTLTLTVTHKPFLITEGYIENKIRAWFAQAPKEG